MSGCVRSQGEAAARQLSRLIRHVRTIAALQGRPQAAEGAMGPALHVSRLRSSLPGSAALKERGFWWSGEGEVLSVQRV